MRCVAAMVFPRSRVIVHAGLLIVACLAMADDRLIRHGRHIAFEIDGKADRRSLPSRRPLPTRRPLPALLSPPSELSLAYLSNAAYNFTTPVAGWKLKAQLNRTSYWLPGESQTHAALYQKTSGKEADGNRKTTCAIVFAVTGSMGNWTGHPDSKETTHLKQCKLKGVHKGMFQEWQALMLQKTWAQKFESHIVKKCDVLLAGGHALGGALASIFAACANGNGNGYATIPPMFKKGSPVTQGQIRRLMNVSGLYTFGAPSVSRVQLVNHLAQDQTFAGGRFYNEDTIYFDPTPFSGTALGLLHPKVAAIRLEDASSGWISRREYDATSKDARREPDYLRTPLARESEIGTYLERVHRAPLRTDLTEPGSIGKSTTTPQPRHVPLIRTETKGYHANLANVTVNKDAFAVPKNASDLRKPSESGPARWWKKIVGGPKEKDKPPFTR